MSNFNVFDSSFRELHIGDVFTPLKWAGFAIEQFDLYSKWIDGATVFDPTMGDGNLLEAIIVTGLAKGRTIDSLPTHHLFGNELNTRYFKRSIEKFKIKYGIDLSDNFTNEDILRLKPRKFDLIFGNPPWQNFVDLPESYKEQIKSDFFRCGLVANPRHLLLGGSRIELSALVVQIAMKDFLKQNGEAILFLPLSLFQNDGANSSFRAYRSGEVNFRLATIFDFNGIDVFSSISTRYGLCHLIRNQNTCFPIPYLRNENDHWKKYEAKPLFHETDPLSIMSVDESRHFHKIEPIVVKKESTPRQGVNSCGANAVFFFDKLEVINADFALVSNKHSGEILLPAKFIFPLITSKAFTTGNPIPSKWVLMPYQNSGKPLEWSEIKQFTELRQYLETTKDILQRRKGLMLHAMLRRGYWWAMLGVGQYSFFPYKVVWEAYGKTRFNPTIFHGNWQANQSLQAFIPVRTLAEAQRIQAELSDTRIENFLRSFRMEGTMNWAQPGKLKKLIRYADEAPGNAD